MIQYNIYFGTIGKTLGCKYRLTKWCKNIDDALEFAKNSASSFFFKYEGKYGLPSYNQIAKESKITGIDIEKLYQEHIEDMMRWYAIPVTEDSIPNRKLKF